MSLLLLSLCLSVFPGFVDPYLLTTMITTVISIMFRTHRGWLMMLVKPPADDSAALRDPSIDSNMCSFDPFIWFGLTLASLSFNIWFVFSLHDAQLTKQIDSQLVSNMIVCAEVFLSLLPCYSFCTLSRAVHVQSFKPEGVKLSRRVWNYPSTCTLLFFLSCFDLDFGQLLFLSVNEYGSVIAATSAFAMLLIFYVPFQVMEWVIYAQPLSVIDASVDLWVSIPLWFNVLFSVLLLIRGLLFLLKTKALDVLELSLSPLHPFAWMNCICFCFGNRMNEGE